MTAVTLPFSDRQDAGAKLAKKLTKFKGKKQTVIAGLLRGGLAVGRVLADRLSLPLVPYIVRKIGHPLNPEYGLGAIAEGGGTVLDESVMRAEGLEFSDIEPIIEAQMEELKRRKARFPRKDMPSFAGKTVILTDDGAATGATMLAVIEDMKHANAARIIVALPVCPPATAARLGEKSDDVIVLAEPSPFLAVAQWYVSFPQLTDEEVLALLDTSSKK